jgi:hypothetical protein
MITTSSGALMASRTFFPNTEDTVISISSPMTIASPSFRDRTSMTNSLRMSVPARTDVSLRNRVHARLQ